VIDRQKTADEIEKIILFARRIDYPVGFEAGLRLAADIVRAVKTADAVEVVRCKDCKYIFPERDCIWCYEMDREVKLTDFCSYGERRKP
jgi:hypothetical protein